MSFLHRAAQSIGFFEFFFRRRDAAGDIRPTDAPHGMLPGFDPLRILVVGEATAVGLGVATHALGPAAQTARRFARLSGRGVTWNALGLPDSRLRTAGSLFRENSLDGLEAAGLDGPGPDRPALDGAGPLGAPSPLDPCAFANVDCVILMAGITDTLCATRVRDWTSQLSAMLDSLEELLPAHGHVLVAEIPPMHNAGSISRAARVAAGVHARAINAATRSVVGVRRRVTMVPFPDTLTTELWVPNSEQEPYREMYATWGGAFAERIADLAPLLTRRES
jgi:hypothetical protein